MTLTRRLTLFFLVSMAMLAIAFSSVLYGLAHIYLHRQLDEQGEAALDALCAVVEAEDEGLDWEPQNRRLLWNTKSEPPIWELFDVWGNRIDGSEESAGGRGWKSFRRVVYAGNPEAVKSEAGHSRYAALEFRVARPYAPVHSTLKRLLFAEIGIALGLWLLAALGARWACRRALAPVRRMSDAAAAMTADDLAERLPVPAPKDELHALASSFNGLLERLQESFERQARFTGEASHQLRTPLTAMLGQLELALRRERGPEEYRRAIGIAVAKIGQLNRIVELLLFLARANGETQLPELESVDLAVFLHRHFDEFWVDHPRRGDMIFSRPIAPISVRIHPALLHQALSNLIENACKYSESGTPIRFELTGAREGSTLSIADSGRGIAPGEQSHIFDPFYRTADIKRTAIPGAGLGLSIAKRIVETLGGTLGVESTLGEGSTFAVTLPLAE